MPVTRDGTWLPDLFDKQWRLLEMCRARDGQRKYILASGSRWAGKSVACLNAICDHCWNVKHANVCVIVPSITVGSDSGIWTELTERIIPEWIEGDFGFEWAPKGKPHQMGQTKKLVCSVMNKWGGVSRIELNSLKDERETEIDFKGRYFTMVYVSEATFVEKRHSYLTLINCLRVKGVAEEDYVFLGDCNPSPLGEDSFWHAEWFVFRLKPDSELTDIERPRQKYLKLIEYFPDDNPFLSEEFKQNKRAEFDSDPDLYARYWLGQWKKATTGALFAAYFKPALHVVGADENGVEQILVPQDDCTELMTSWDFGPVNPFVCFAEKFYCLFPVVGKPGETEELPCFKFFDEIGLLDVTREDDIALGEFTQMVCETRDKWTKLVGKPVPWIHYSDRSAFDHRESISNIYQYQEVFAASNGTIELIAVDKPSGSVQASIRLWRKLLLQGRLLFSESLTPKLIEMNRNLSAGKDGRPIAKHTPYKHPFDAARYLLMRECYSEITANILVLQNANRTSSRVISVPL